MRLVDDICRLADRDAALVQPDGFGHADLENRVRRSGNAVGLKRRNLLGGLVRHLGISSAALIKQGPAGAAFILRGLDPNGATHQNSVFFKFSPKRTPYNLEQ